MLEKNTLEIFDKATSLDIIKCNLNDLNNIFEYLFQTLFFLVYSIG